MPRTAAHDYEVRDAINQIVEASRRLLDSDARPVPRGQHPKQHGCVRARFVVEPGLGEHWAQGVFQPGRVYDAWIRFSNGAQRDDRKPDAHGMAIKLMEVAGPKVLATERDAPTQDFVMVDSPTFFLRGAVEYARFSHALLKARGKEPSSLYNILGLCVRGQTRSLATLVLLYVLPWRLPTFLRMVRFARKTIANPLTTRYWSTTPYKFGETCMKFSAVPAEFPEGVSAAGPIDDSYGALAEFLRPAGAARPVTATAPVGDSADYLRGAMARRLAERGAAFLFQVQRFQNDRTTPIEDSTAEWTEEAAPFQTVARIWIPRQVFDTPGRMAFGENLSFTPWHALPAHEPLGQINRIRKEVYSHISEVRHHINGGNPVEPHASDPDPTHAPPQWGDDPSAFSQVLHDELDLIRARRRHVEAQHRHGGDPDGTRPADDPGGQAVSFRDGRLPPPESPGSSVPSRDDDTRTRQLRGTALNEHTTGLALGGPGVRGATFAAGFLQGLAALGLIRRFDYLSTAGGGSYAGAWLAAWLKREGGHPENVERQLASSRVEQARATRRYLTGEVVDPEPQPVRHLRSATRSLVPPVGLLSTDTWTEILTRSRNVIVHLLVLLPLLVLVVTGARLAVSLYRFPDEIVPFDQRAAAFDSRLGTPVFLAGVVVLGLMFLGGVLALGLASSSIIKSLRDLRRTDPRWHHEPDPRDPDAAVNRRIVTPVLVAALLLSISVPPIGRAVVEQAGQRLGPDTGSAVSFRAMVEAVWAQFTPLGGPTFLLHALAIGGLLAWGASGSSTGVAAARRKPLVGASFGAGAAGGVLLVLLEGLMAWLARLGRPDLLATLVPPLAILIVVASLIVAVALSGRAAGEAERQWWARVSALLTKQALFWTAGMATMVYLPGLVVATGGLSRALLAAVWLGSAALGLLAARSVLPRLDGARARGLARLASVAALVFFTGLLGSVALVVALLANVPSLTAPQGDDSGPFAFYLQGVNGTSLWTLLVIAVGAAILYALARRLIDVNLFVLTARDAGRLTHCYLGGSRPVPAWRARWAPPRDPRVGAGAPALSDPAGEPALPPRNPNPLTGFDSRDDLDLLDLRIGRKSEDGRVYWGPHLLINTTLHLEGMGAIDRRGVAGESFLLSPLFCGAPSVGYARTEHTKPPGGRDATLTLGWAMALSGAAGDARARLVLSSLLSSLSTLFDARPGGWIQRPKPVGWTAANPRAGDLPVAAFLGLTDAGGDFVYLGGPGPFDRLGASELIRRHCRYIVAVDAGEAGDTPDAGLATLIGRCRIDLGLRIPIDTRPLHPEGAGRMSRFHVAIGVIHYEEVDPSAAPGLLVYVQSSMTGDEPPDIRHHARQESRFPHQPARRGHGFAEEQFEGDRGLGEHVARAVFGDAVPGLPEPLSDPARQSHDEFIPRLFAAIQKRWTETPTDQGEQPAAPLPSRAKSGARRGTTGPDHTPSRLPTPAGDSEMTPARE